MKIFLWIIRNCLPASLMIATVLLLRFLVGKRNSRLMCILWTLVAFALICPLRVYSPVALWDSSRYIVLSDKKSEAGTIENGRIKQDYIDNGEIKRDYADNGINYGMSDYSEDIRDFVFEGDEWPSVVVIIWIIGIFGGALYGLLSCVHTKHLISEAAAKDGYQLCDGISYPFVFGVFRPQIFIPSSTDEKYIEYILRHERIHIRKKDNLKKVIGYSIALVYWMNPIVWVAYYFYGRDLELTCDREVTLSMKEDEQKQYISALLYFAQYRHTVFMYKSLFSEGNLKERIVSILQPCKRRTFVLTIAGMLLTVAVFFTVKESGASEISGAENMESYMECSTADRDIAADYYPEGYEGYLYPLLPKMSDWPYGDHGKMTAVCQIPEELLMEMTTDELIQTVAAYPLWGDVYAYGDFDKGYDNIYATFNGLRELSNREKVSLMEMESCDLIRSFYPLAFSILEKYF